MRSFWSALAVAFVVSAQSVVAQSDTETEARFTLRGDPLTTLPLIESFALFQGAGIQISGSETQTVTVTSESNDVLAVISLTEDEAADGDSVWITTQSPRNPASAFVIGTDSIVIATSEVNPIGAVSMADVQAVFRGDIANWKDLGGGDNAITVHVATGDTGFEDQVTALGLKPSESTDVRTYTRVKDAADAVANDPFGLAVLPYSQLRTARAFNLRGSCGMHTSASVFSLKSGSYPMGYPLYASVRSDKDPEFLREFVEFMQSSFAQDVIADLGFADMGIDVLGLDRQGQRLASSLMNIGIEVPLSDVRDMTSVMSGAQMLSATFRFQSDTTQLNDTSRENIKALAAGIMLGNYADKEIHVLGFSDGSGRAQQNKSLSKEQAEAVRAALQDAIDADVLADVSFNVLGFGEASPLVCEDTNQDAQINRRVEIWIKDRTEPVKADP